MKQQQSEINKNQQTKEKDLQKAKTIKSVAQQYFNNKQYSQALLQYQLAIQLTPQSETVFLAILHNNISICLNQQQMFQKAINYSTKKAYITRSFSYEKTNKYQEACEDLKNANKLQYNYQYQKKINYLEKKAKEQFDKKKDEVIDGLKQLGNSVLGYFGYNLNNFKLQKNQNGSYNINFKQ